MSAERVAQDAIIVVIIGMAIVNFGLRFVPLAVIRRVSLPEPVARWLSFIPIAVMGSLVATEVARPGGEWTSPLSNPSLWAAAATMLAFRLTRSFLGATVLGIICYVALRALMS